MKKSMNIWKELKVADLSAVFVAKRQNKRYRFSITLRLMWRASRFLAVFVTRYSGLGTVYIGTH